MISVITVCFNSEATIGDTLRSVAEQQCSDVEHVIVDGGSTDGTGKVIEALRTPRTRVLSEPDRGLYDAMNKGLRMARGELVCFLNGDDFYTSESVLRTVVDCHRRTGADAIYGDIEYVDPLDTQRITRRWVSGRPSLVSVQLGWHPPHPAFFARTELLRRLGGFALDLPIAADYELMLKVLLRRPFQLEYVAQCLVHMREGGSSTSGIRSHLVGNWQSYLAMKRNGVVFPAAAVWAKPMRKLLQFVPQTSMARTETGDCARRPKAS